MKVSLHPAQAFSKDAPVGRPGSVTSLFGYQGQMLAGAVAQEVSRLFVVSALCKVSALFRQIRVGVGLDLDVSLDAKVLEANHFVMT